MLSCLYDFCPLHNQYLAPQGSLQSCCDPGKSDNSSNPKRYLWCLSATMEIPVPPHFTYQRSQEQFRFWICLDSKLQFEVVSEATLGHPNG